MTVDDATHDRREMTYCCPECGVKMWRHGTTCAPEAR